MYERISFSDYISTGNKIIYTFVSPPSLMGRIFDPKFMELIALQVYELTVFKGNKFLFCYN